MGQLEPADTQLLLKQQPPPPHEFPVQHGWPAPPQLAQMPARQTPEAPQTSPAQHASPGAPHAWQVALAQVSPAAAQVLFAQQGWPAMPHEPPVQAPPWHVPALAPHEAFASTQLLPTQQPPPLQVLPGQHCSPLEPQLPPSGKLTPGRPQLHALSTTSVTAVSTPRIESLPGP